MFSIAPSLNPAARGRFGGPDGKAGIFEILDGPWYIEPQDLHGARLGQMHGWVASATRSELGLRLTTQEVIAHLDGNQIFWVGPNVRWKVSKLAAAGADFAGYRRCTAVVTGDLPWGADPKANPPKVPKLGTARTGFHASAWCRVTSTYAGVAGDVSAVAYVQLSKLYEGSYLETFNFPAAFRWVGDGVTWLVEDFAGVPDVSAMNRFNATLTLG